MKKIICVLVLGVCLFGCTLSEKEIEGSKILENEKWEPELTIVIEYEENRITKLHEKIDYGKRDAEFYNEFMMEHPMDEETKLFAKDKYILSLGLRDGIEKWDYVYDCREENVYKISRVVELDVEKMSESDKKLASDMLKYYDFDDVEKTKENLEKEGFTIE